MGPWFCGMNLVGGDPSVELGYFSVDTIVGGSGAAVAPFLVN
jgi:hypothetical protein